MKIGIYGGTFDPPHLGHMAAARSVMNTLGLDKLLLVPAKIPPHKDLPSDSAGVRDRLKMAELMADGLDPADGRVEVSSIEVDRPGKSYTVDTLEQLAREYPDDELWLLMGSDMLLTFHQWKDPRRICALAGLCAFARSRMDDVRALHDAAQRVRADYGGRVTVTELEDGVDISSTQLRGQLARDPDGASPYLWCQVYGYILQHGLYGVSADMKALTDARLRAVSYGMMRAKRIPHVQGTEEEAVRLALRWGARVDYARRAAILHDCTKYWTQEEHLALCDRYGVPLDDMERQAEKLLHSKTGAALAKHIFGEPDEVCSAIFYHTTGKGNMTLLEKILYIADYMEPHRDFPGVDDLRKAAYGDLDRAVIMGCEMSVEEMARKHRAVHPNTYAALSSLKGMDI